MAFSFGSYGNREEKPETHWKGPYDVLVPMSMTSVPAHDGFNQLMRNDDGHCPPQCDISLILSQSPNG